MKSRGLLTQILNHNSKVHSIINAQRIATKHLLKFCFTATIIGKSLVD